MSTLFTIDLTVNMPDGGRHAKQLLNLYFSDMPADINETAFKLCDADQGMLAQKFDKPVVKRADAWPGPQGSLEIFALISASGQDAAFMKQVIAKYMDDFPEYLRKASEKYFSRNAFPPTIPLKPIDWKAEVH